MLDGIIYRADDLPELTRLMVAAAEALRFEEAARIRDQIKAIESHGSVSSQAQPVKKVGREKQRRRKR